MGPVSLSSRPAVNGQHRSDEVGQFVWDVRADTWWWSDALYRLLGYQPGAVTASLEWFLQHKAPEDQATVDAVFTRCLAEGGPFSCYHHVVDAHGYGRRLLRSATGIATPPTPRPWPSTASSST